MLSTVRIAAISAAITAVAVTSTAAFAQKKYDTGASDTEIKKIGRASCRERV